MSRRTTEPAGQSPGEALRDQPEAPKRHKSLVREYIQPLVVIFLVALAIRTVVIHAYRIPSGSMEDTLLVGDYLLANRFVYGAPIEIPFTGIVLGRLPALSRPKRGDILIFASWSDTTEDFIKRCVALPGDTVLIAGDVLSVNGRPFESILHERFGRDPRVYPQIKSLPARRTRIFGMRGVDPSNYGPHVVPEGHFFAMGDNRHNSADSRFNGDVPLRRLKARAMIVYWSMDTDMPVWNLGEFVRWDRIGRLIH